MVLLRLTRTRGSERPMTAVAPMTSELALLQGTTPMTTELAQPVILDRPPGQPRPPPPLTRLPTIPPTTPTTRRPPLPTPSPPPLNTSPSRPTLSILLPPAALSLSSLLLVVLVVVPIVSPPSPVEPPPPAREVNTPQVHLDGHSRPHLLLTQDSSSPILLTS